MKNASYSLFILLCFFAFSLPAMGQFNYELNGGYQHLSGDQGLDGFSVGGAIKLAPNFQLFANYDGAFDHSTLGALALTSSGLTFVNSDYLSVLTGPRIFLPGVLKSHGTIKGHKLHPFVEVLLGEARLQTHVRATQIGEVDASDTAFAWGIGGGADFIVSPHFAVRPNLDILRTHFTQSGQTRLRVGISVVWSRRSRRD